MKLLFLGLEQTGVTRGGEYEIVEAIKRYGGYGYIIVCDDGLYRFIDYNEYELI